MMKSWCFRRRLALALALLVGVPVTAAANEVRERELVVTASRTALSIDSSLSSVSVIDRAAIEASGSADLVDLLRRQAGIDAIRGGGIGAQTSLFLRGAGSNQLLVLVDGVRVASANTGGYAWEHLALDQIERIEIVRGPRAALYGSDAIGGVIQLFTRRQAGADGHWRLGNHDTYGVDLGYGRRSERGGAGLRLGGLDSRGFTAQNPNGFAFDPDRDGADLRNVMVWAERQYEAVNWSGSWRRGDDRVEFDQGRSRVRSQQLQSRLDGAGWALQASAASEDTDTPVFFARFESRRQQLDWQQERSLSAGGQLLWGVTAAHERGRNLNTFDGSEVYGDDRELLAGFAAWRHGRGDFDWELAARHDDYGNFADASTGQAALSWRPSQAVSVRINGGQGFRAPNLNELFSPGFGGGFFAGNPALRPERAAAIEMALEVEGAGWQQAWRLYRNDVRDLIDFSGADTFYAINIGRARLQGVEWVWETALAGWQLDGNLGWQRAEDRDAEVALLRRAARKANLSLSRQFGAVSLALDLHAASSRRDIDNQSFAPIELPGYGLVGLSLGSQLSTAWRWTVRVDNLFDRHYELVRGFNAPGTSVQLLLHWQRPQ